MQRRPWEGAIDGPISPHERLVRATVGGGHARERGLNHRAAHETPTIPIPPDLVRLLRAHIRRYGTTPDGRIFQTSEITVPRGAEQGAGRADGRPWWAVRCNEARTPPA